MSNSKLKLIYGEDHYYVFKNYKNTKNKIIKEGKEVREFIGSSKLDFKEIYNALNSYSLFSPETTVIIREIMDGKKVCDFIEDLLDYLKTNKSFNSEIYIYQYGNIPKNLKVYKYFNEFGEITEEKPISEVQIIETIQTQTKLSKDLARFVYQKTKPNTFALLNEQKKIKLIGLEQELITQELLNDLIYSGYQEANVWDIGNLLMRFLVSKKSQEFLDLFKTTVHLLGENKEPMQILYSFYQEVLNGIKLKAYKKKRMPFRACLSLGYFFVKDFFESIDQVSEEELYSLNSKLIDYEFSVKRGEVHDKFALVSLLLTEFQNQ